MGLLVIKDPAVIRVEQEGPVTTYTVQGRLIGTSSEIPADAVQVYKVDGREDALFLWSFWAPLQAPVGIERFFRLKFRLSGGLAFRTGLEVG